MVKAIVNMEKTTASQDNDGDVVVVGHSKLLQSSERATSNDLEDSEDDSSSDDDYASIKPQPKLSNEKDPDYTPPADEVCATRQSHAFL